MKLESTLAWTAVIVVNAMVTFHLLNLGRLGFSGQSYGKVHNYTYIDDDYPFYYPVSSGPLEDVAMSLYDTVHFDFFVHRPSKAMLEISEAEDEWRLLGYIPSSYGRVRMGPESRIFLITVFHLTHCLQSFHDALSGPTSPAENLHHMDHCLNYYRQAILCSADAGIEEGDFIDIVVSEEDAELLTAEERIQRKSFGGGAESTGSWHPGRIRADVVCKDWDVLFRDLELNYKQWLDWGSIWN